MTIPRDLEIAIRQRDLPLITKLLFEGDPPRLARGRASENDLIDFKSDCPAPSRTHSEAWAEIARDVLAFHNNKGGLLVFGFDNAYRFLGARVRIDSKLFNDQVRRYLGDRIWVEYFREAIQHDQRYLGIALIPPRGPAISRFRVDGPRRDGRLLFLQNGSAMREGDTSRTLTPEEADRLARSLAVPTIGKPYEIDEPFYRILSPDYSEFIDRPALRETIAASLRDSRVTSTTLIGPGGVGKTALATWLALREYDSKRFGAVVSMTAKDRELTPQGIRALEPRLTTFETLLSEILEVLGLSGSKSASVAEQEANVRALLRDSGTLLYIDNLETVDDARLVGFLEDLPNGVHALVTSRRATIRVSTRPISVGALQETEALRLLEHYKHQPGLAYLHDLSAAERTRVVRACNAVPLALRWCVMRSRAAAQLLQVADSLTQSHLRDDELLEFSFRRVFDAMTGAERAVLKVIALFERPVPIEVLLVGTKLGQSIALDAVEALSADAIVQRLFDPDHNDYSYALLPITRAFTYKQVRTEPGFEETVRHTLADWFEARDIRDEARRLTVRNIRQRRVEGDTALVDLARAAAQRNELDAAESFFQNALARAPRSWRVAHEFAEFCRHKRGHLADALRYYEIAGANAPLRGPERARIFREWGFALKDSGLPDATDLAIERVRVALHETPNDLIAVDGLARLLSRKGAFREVVALIEPHRTTLTPRNREMLLPLLAKAYREVGEDVKYLRLMAELGE